MDCESGLKALTKGIWKPGCTMGTNMDLVLLHKQLKEKSKHTVLEEWVIGQADTKKKDFPKTITPVKKDNTQCDADAEDCVADGMPPRHFQPYPGGTEQCSRSMCDG